MGKQSFDLSIFDIIHEVYVNIIDQSYNENYISNTIAYPFYTRENCDLTIVINDTNYFEDVPALLFISLKKEDVNKELLENLTNLVTTKDIQNFSNHLDIKRAIIEKLNFGVIISFHILNDGLLSLINKKNSYIKNLITRDILSYREKHSRIMNSKNSMLSKKAYNDRYQFSKYDIDDAINYFGTSSKENTMQLETLFEQAMFCFEHNKFLASAACVGVAIEELCVLILEDCGFDENIRHKNTSIIELGGILRGKGIITRRTSSVLVASSVIRNSISHASSGFVSAVQTENLIATFKYLFEQYLNYKNR